LPFVPVPSKSGPGGVGLPLFILFSCCVPDQARRLDPAGTRVRRTLAIRQVIATASRSPSRGGEPVQAQTAAGQ
jgi:hypothetical protein